MTTYYFDRNELEQKLAPLPSRSQAAFGASCSERLLPNYLAFQKECGFGDYEKLRHCLSWVWTIITEVECNLEAADRWLATIDDLTPDTEDYASASVSFALDACTSLHSLVRFLKDKNLNNILDIAAYARDTLYMHITRDDDDESDSGDIVSKTDAHPQMQREFRQQHLDIAFLSRNSPLSDQRVRELRALWTDAPRSCIGFSP